MQVHVIWRFAETMLLMLLQSVLHVHRKLGPHGGRRQLTKERLIKHLNKIFTRGVFRDVLNLNIHLSYVQFLWKLIQNRTIAVPILINHGNNQSDQLVPKFDRIQPRTMIFRLFLRLVRLHHEIPVEQFVGVLEQELICRSRKRKNSEQLHHLW